MASARRPTLLLVLVLCLEAVSTRQHPADDTGVDVQSDDDAELDNEEVSDGSDNLESQSTSLGGSLRAGGGHGGHHEGEHARKHHHGHHQGGTKPTHWNKVMQDVKKANEHYLRIRTQAPCKEPRPRVIKVKEVYPDSSKEYLPRCTLLHRCGNDIGCCDHETMQCVAKTTHTVYLHFYTLRLSTGGGTVSVHSGNTIERLPFVNHTECECQMLNDRPRVGSPEQRSRCPECPGEFSIRELSNGGCTCDCFDRQKNCIRFKRGRETLADTDRRCVESGRCNAPECEYGYYDPNAGRCPRKHERRNAPQPEHHSPLWRLDERD